MFLFAVQMLLLSHQIIGSNVPTWRIDEEIHGTSNCSQTAVQSTKKTEEQVQRVDIIREKDECEYAHQIIRNIHSEREMVWNEDLAYSAEQWAIHLATEVGKIQHSSFTFKNGSRYGENLYQLNHGLPAGCNLAVHAWYNEIHGYNYAHPGRTLAHGHFTQLVWNQTTHFGVGIGYNPKTTRTFIVARYVPPGNWDFNDYKKDIWRPKPGSHIPTLRELLPIGARDPLLVDIGYIEQKKSNKKPDCLDTVDCTFYVKQNDCNIPHYKPFMQRSCYKSCSKCVPGDPIDGGWTHWHNVDLCTVTCGGGLITSYRFCTKPYPKYGGKDCAGERVRKTQCNTHACPVPGEENNLRTTATTTTTTTTTSSKPVLFSTTRSTIITTTAKQISKSCKDKNKSCPDYEKLGYCTGSKYSQWMYLNCKLSCDVCNSKRFIPAT